MRILAKKLAAFSSFEMMLTITILAITIGFSLLFHQTSQLRADLNTQTALVIAHMRLAQSNAVAGAMGKPTGIHIDSTSFTAYVGPSYDALSASNTIVALPATLSFTNTSLAGGGSNILFTSPRGETVHVGNFRITSSQLNTFNTITISSLGTIN